MRATAGKNEIKQIIGLHSREAGEQFERIILDACEYYRMNESAEINKTPEPMKVLKSIGEGRFVACFAKKGEPDFKGCHDNGRCVCFEAKHTEHDRIARGAVTGEQEKVLDRYTRMNADCFVVVSFSFFTFYRVPWGVWKNMKQIYGRKYITEEDAKQYRIKFKCGILDFLDKASQRKVGGGL